MKLNLDNWKVKIETKTKYDILHKDGFLLVFMLTLKHREMHVCVVSTVATDALVQKHQAISIHNAD